jgi:hypothetical protein
MRGYTLSNYVHSKLLCFEKSSLCCYAFYNVILGKSNEALRKGREQEKENRINVPPE